MLDEEIISQIKNIIKDDSIIVSCSFPPNYLLPFLDEKEILYIYKLKKLSNTTSLDGYIRSNLDSDSEELELTGQPLECPFSSDDESFLNCVTEIKEKDKHCPISLKNARKIISFSNLSLNLTVPTYVLTEGTDKDHTILLGMIKNNGWCTRSWINLQDVNDGTKIANVEDMINKHHKLSFINPRHTVSEVSCKYVIESIDDVHATFLQESTGHLEFNLSWKTPTFFIPMNEASVKITISSLIGHDTSDVSIMWFHLILLYDYLEIIKKWRAERNVQGIYSRHNVNFPNIKQFLTEQTTSQSAFDRLIQLLREPNRMAGATITGRNNGNEKRTLQETVKNLTGEKKEQEFTDQLWNLLIECTSYDEVCTSFNTLFQNLRNGTCKPYMKSSNVSRLAHAFRCCRNDPNRFDMILEPLELLIEIGIEKLKKEYISVYLLAKIATFEQLCVPSLPKFSEINSTDWVDTCSFWIMWLLKIHITLQLMLLTESTVKCKSCIIPLTTSALAYYLNPESPIQELLNPRTITLQTFTTSLNTTDISDLLNRKIPFNSWTLKLISEIPNRKVKSIFYRDLDELFPSSVSLINDVEVGDNATFLTNAFPYYCYDYHSISDLFE